MSINFTIQEETKGPYDFDSVYKTYTYDQDKTFAPSRTYATMYKKIKKVTESARLIEIQNSPPIFSYDFTDGILTTHGKGGTIDQAKASCIMEFAERYSWLHFDYKKASGYQKISFNDLSKETNIDYLHDALRFSADNNNEELNEPLKEIPLRWIDGYSITKKENIKYPLSWINYLHGSNGLCSGNTKEEAIVQGICEVLERNNCNKYARNYKNEKINIIDASSISHPLFDEILEFLKNEGTELILLHIPTGCDVPVVMAGFINESIKPAILKKSFGYGCHTSPLKAVFRAITEYFQIRSGTIKEQTKIPFEIDIGTGNWFLSLDLDLKWIKENNPVVQLSEIKDISSNNFSEEIANLVAITQDYGIELLVADKTHPKLNTPVFRVFSPQSEPPSNILKLLHAPEWVVIQLYYEAGMIEEAKNFYKDHNSFIKDMSTDLISQVGGSIFGSEIANVINSLLTLQPNPEIDKICYKNYIIAQQALPSFSKKMQSQLKTMFHN